LQLLSGPSSFLGEDQLRAIEMALEDRGEIEGHPLELQVFDEGCQLEGGQEGAEQIVGAFYFLRETKLPPVHALRDAGVPIALATDHNPGSSPGLSLLLMLNMACTLFRLTPEEALRGATLNGALALGLRDRGRLRAGQRADFVVWDLDHANELAYWFGRNPCRRRIVAGEETAR
jgi:imidazolonepropionase